MINFDSWIQKISGGESHWSELESADEKSKEALKTEILKRFPTSFVSRREFIEWMGGLMVVLGLPACTRQPEEKIVPYVRSPENMIPGKPLFFATSFMHDGAADGLLVESHMGRPTKIEGNPDHPGSLGATGVFAQASILDLYDPDRLQQFQYRNMPSTYNAFAQGLSQMVQSQQGTQGSGIRLVTESVISPTLGSQIKAFLAAFPKAKWHVVDGVSRKNVHDGNQMAFGEAVNTYYKFDKADVILSLDADFLHSGPGHVRYAREFASRRRSESKQANFNRLYSLHCTPSGTEACADHAWPVNPQNLMAVALTVAKSLGVNVNPPPLNSELQKIATVMAKDLKSHSGSSIVVTSPYQPAELTALCHAMNTALGNVGRTVMHTAPLEENLSSARTLEELTQDLKSEQVQGLIILGGNPVYHRAADPKLADLIRNVKHSVHHTLLPNETTGLCVWQAPGTHYLESWSDAKAYDGTVSVVQPLIAPLYSGKSAHELLSGLSGDMSKSGYESVRGYWRTKLPSAFDASWNKTIHDGVLTNSALAEKKVSLKPFVVKGELSAPVKGIQLILRPDPTVWDGRFSNNAWLQELPKPVTKVTWDNAVYVSRIDAAKLQLKTGDVVKLSTNAKSLEGPVWVLPGQPEGVFTVHLGYGRTLAGRVGNDIGFNVSLLRNDAAAWTIGGVTVDKTPKNYILASTQRHFEMEGRDHVKQATVEDYRKNPEVIRGKKREEEAKESEREAEVLAPPKGPVFEDPNYAWGMAIDLSVCNGCNACVVACQSENNIAVVGKEEVHRQRVMQWLRVDRYYENDVSNNPPASFQPVPCMHCEKAPCEVVCPVAATSHSPEGVNEMTYNRCVGTKYCSNNCPYKVRRFNFYLYSDLETPSLKLQRNPNVTVRSRGVMEKCTYCVQRINAARIEAKKEDRLIRDGEIVPACAAACPSQSISFGNIKDPNSKVSKLKAEPLNYALLEELGTRPRTTYLAKLRNPNPEIPAGLLEKSF